MSIKTSLHAQGYEPWALDYLGETGAQWIKFVNVFPLLGGVNIIGRVRAMNEGESDALVARGEQGAVEYYDAVRAEMDKNRHVALWEGPNEVSIWIESVLAGFHDFYQRLIQLYQADGFPIMAGQFNTGWPFLPSDDGGRQSRIVGQAIQGADGVSFHEYDPENMILGEARKTMLRYRITTDYWRSLGLTVPPVFITECGLDRTPGTASFGHDGWKTILDGNLAEYIRQLCWYESELQKDDYVQAATIFSVITNWDDFELDQKQCMELAWELVKVEPPPPERARGIDVSYWQCEDKAPIDWQAVADSDVEFAIIRASVADIIDKYWEVNYQGALAAGLLVGAFHYLHPTAGSQAGTFARAVEGKDLALGCWADIEHDDLTAAKCDNFFKYADPQIEQPIHIYTSASKFNKYGTPDWAQGRLLWVADYRDRELPELPTAWNEWEFWQTTSDGAVPGIEGRVDLDVYAGTPEQLFDAYGNGGEEPIMECKIFDVTGAERDWDWLIETYGAVNIQKPDATSYFKITEIREKHDDATFIARVRNADGSPKVGKTVLLYWSDAPDAPGSGWLEQGVGGVTNENGDAGFPMGGGAYYTPPEGGPHKSWLFGEDVSEMVEGIGFRIGPDGPTNHDHLDITWQYVEGEDPEPEPEGDLAEVVEQLTRIADAEERQADALESIEERWPFA